jgi:NADH dehydrogenase/NADH:ubiquinone oxidoreductase subunit G
MSGIFDKLKDVGKDALGTFVVLDDDGNEQEASAGDRTQAQPRQAAASSAAAPAGAAAPHVAVPAVAGAPDPEFVQQLKASTDASKKTAYTQFKALFTALGAVADEGTRTQLAISAAQASHGFGAAQVAEAIDDRLKILAAEKASFDHAVKEETDHSVGGSQAEIEKTRAEITRKIEEIKALETRAAELERAAAEARATIDANSARFAASYAVVEAELAAERARIAPFLSPAK